jgi:hypothetical protein
VTVALQQVAWMFLRARTSGQTQSSLPAAGGDEGPTPERDKCNFFKATGGLVGREQIDPLGPVSC